MNQLKKILTTHPLKSYFYAFFGFYILTTILRFLIKTGPINFTMQQGYVILSALCFTLTIALYNFHKKVIFTFILGCLLCVGVSCIKISDQMMISDREVVHNVCLSVILFSLPFLMNALKEYVSNKALKILFTLLKYITLFFALIPLLFVWGYFVVSGGHMLTSDIILTFFQTNIPEVIAYLHEQNLFLWLGTTIILFISFVFFFKLYAQPIKKNIKLLLLNIFFMLYLLIFIFHKLSSSFILNISHSVFATLESFEKYQAMQAHIEERINNLASELTEQSYDGIYVLIVGESTTRDHMHAYGYERENTPWLSVLKNKEGSIIFQKAYSNHVHTVPSVQFALTQQNQYENIQLEDAYSIIEVAQAAGFDTFWISNQKQFSVGNTPLNTIAASADEKYFINSYAGTKTMTTYYDEKLADTFPDLSKKKKALLVFHLMGCHAVYNERYPTQFEKFSDKDSRVDSYDNAVLYNDFVLQKIYEAVSKYPQFMALTYFSDHGEDPDHGLTHEATKFTYQMSHIPVVMVFSKAYIHTHPDTYKALQNRQDTPFTSDLIFNAMTSVMGIHGIKNENKTLDISSETFNLSAEKLRTLHGNKSIIEDLTSYEKK